ncbi:hypothetical protein ACOMHN_039055 [Nucella lapillus]
MDGSASGGAARSAGRAVQGKLAARKGTSPAVGIDWPCGRTSLLPPTKGIGESRNPQHFDLEPARELNNHWTLRAGQGKLAARKGTSPAVGIDWPCGRTSLPPKGSIGESRNPQHCQPGASQRAQQPLDPQGWTRQASSQKGNLTGRRNRLALWEDLPSSPKGIDRGEPEPSALSTWSQPESSTTIGPSGLDKAS